MLFSFAALIVGLFVGSQVARRIGFRLAPLFAQKSARKTEDLVGKVCTITTQTVTENFGQAELIDTGHTGSALILQVRAPVPNDFSAGDTAILYEYTDGEFTITPDTTESL